MKTVITMTMNTIITKGASRVLDDFFTRAIIAGIGLALTTGPLGCFIIWRRMAYFGDTMAHSALLGVALALIFDINLMVGVFAVAVAISAILLLLQRRHTLSADSLLGILSHATLSLGLVLMAFMTWVRVDLLSFLFGDILAVSRIDIAFIYGGGALILAVLAWLWRPLLAATVSEDIARAEGMNPALSRIIFMLLAIVIAIAMKIVGILLITSLLIIPAATARRFASTHRNKWLFWLRSSAPPVSSAGFTAPFISIRHPARPSWSRHLPFSF